MTTKVHLAIPHELKRYTRDKCTYNMFIQDPGEAKTSVQMAAIFIDVLRDLEQKSNSLRGRYAQEVGRSAHVFGFTASFHYNILRNS